MAHDLRKQIHKVQPLLRLKKSKMNNHAYDPMIVSIGPYHHDKPTLSAAEELKSKYLNRLVSNNINTKNLLKDKILKEIDNIRGCYAEKLDKYDDEALALMMLKDACFILTFLEGVEKEGNIYMEGEAGEGVTISLESAVVGDETSSIFFDWHRCLGRGTLGVVTRDLMVLENQIPFYVIKLIISEEDKAKGKDILPRKFLNWILLKKFQFGVKIPSENENPPLHFVEALHRMIVDEDIDTTATLEQQKQPDPSPDHQQNGNSFKFLKRKKGTNKGRQVYDQDIIKEYHHISWSVMDLKAKGVTFMRSKSHSMRSIRFESGALYGVKLYLPPLMISPNAQNNLLNIIAYEMSPDSDTNYEVVSYSNFIKSLIATPEDVKELQEQNILINKFHNQAQVVDVFRGIETFGLNNFDILNEVKKGIREHCQNRVKTWLAEFIHTRFSTPWSMAAFFAGIFVIILTFLQTYFTINPKKDPQKGN